MDRYFGYPIADWNAAKEEMRQVLIERAKERETIPYSEVVQKVQRIRFEPNSYGFQGMLAEISEAENAAGRGMLSAVVVNKDEMKPGDGFLTLAEKLGRNTSDTLKCWLEELAKVHTYWNSHQ